MSFFVTAVTGYEKSRQLLVEFLIESLEGGQNQAKDDFNPPPNLYLTNQRFDLPNIWFPNFTLLLKDNRELTNKTNMCTCVYSCVLSKCLLKSVFFFSSLVWLIFGLV